MNALTGPAAEKVDEVAKTSILTYATLDAAVINLQREKDPRQTRTGFSSLAKKDNETP